MVFGESIAIFVLSLLLECCTIPVVQFSHKSLLVQAEDP